MGAKTGIEWTDATWNPIIGCSRVSEGCRNCYAEGTAGRFGNGSETVYSGLTQIVNGRAVWTGQIKETRQLLKPLSWRPVRETEDSPDGKVHFTKLRSRRIFVNSMSDLFHENVSDELIDRIFAVMALCPQHTFQVLTKRPERMLKWFTEHFRIYSPGAREMVFGYVQQERGYSSTDSKWITKAANAFDVWPLPNVWLGVSVENQKAADERVPLLLKTPAAVRFISAEPLLGPVNLRTLCEEVEGYVDSLCGLVVCDGRGTKEINAIDWVICGGESGPGARPMHPDWARGLRDQCKVSGVPFFFKQWGEWFSKDQIEQLKTERSFFPFSGVGLAYLDGKSETRPGRDIPDPEFGLRAWDLDGNDGCAAVYRIGKKAAGAQLDGVEHKEFPAVRA
jgi:protein gp37